MPSRKIGGQVGSLDHPFTWAPCLLSNLFQLSRFLSINTKGKKGGEGEAGQPLLPKDLVGLSRGGILCPRHVSVPPKSHVAQPSFLSPWLSPPFPPETLHSLHSLKFRLSGRSSSLFEDSQNGPWESPPPVGREGSPSFPLPSFVSWSSFSPREGQRPEPPLCSRRGRLVALQMISPAWPLTANPSQGIN